MSLFLRHNLKPSRVNSAGFVDIILSFFSMVGATIFAFLSMTVAFFTVLWLSAYSIKPLVIEYTEYTIKNNRYEIDNTSYKTWVGETFCSTPTNDQKIPDAVVVFEDRVGHREVVLDNASGLGTGTMKSRTWHSDGVIPPGLAVGVVNMWKAVRYRCFAGIANVEVTTEEHHFLWSGDQIMHP